MKMRWYFFILILAMLAINLFSLHLAVFADDSITVDFIAAGIEHNASLIKDITFNCKRVFDIKNEKDNPYKEEMDEGEWIKKGDMEYWERIEQLNNLQIIFASTKGKTMTWIKDLTHPEDPGYGEIIIGKGKFDMYISPIELAFGYFSSPKWPEVFRNGTAKLLGTESIDGNLCHIINCKRNPEEKWEYKIWIDTERGFQPLKIQKISPDRGVTHWYDSIKLQEFIGGIWIPVKATFHVAAQKVNVTSRSVPPIKIDYLPESEEVRICTDIKINQGIPDEQFIIEWTKGTSVWDRIRDRHFTIGEDISAKQLLQELQIIEEKKPKE